MSECSACHKESSVSERKIWGHLYLQKKVPEESVLGFKVKCLNIKKVKVVCAGCFSNSVLQFVNATVFAKNVFFFLPLLMAIKNVFLGEATDFLSDIVQLKRKGSPQPCCSLKPHELLQERMLF